MWRAPPWGVATHQEQTIVHQKQWTDMYTLGHEEVSMVHSSVHSPARLVLVQATESGCGE